ncbi:MAG TPA: hypothetical protein VM056_05690 [Terriglobales bacterium]|nr:hypothetical protein [Terriglobales bacterium]
MKTIKGLLGFAVVVVVLVSAWVILPPYFSNYQFKDDVIQEARFANVSNPPKSDEDIRNNLMKKVREYDMPIKPEQIQINRSGSNIMISVPYTVVVKFPTGHTYTLKFNPATEKENRGNN